MLRYLKAMHILGAAMFLGSILGHITVGFVPGIMEDPDTLLVGRQAIELATLYVTLPGLGLIMASGAVMILAGRMPVRRLRWLMLHGVLGALIVLNAWVVLAPGGAALLDLAGQLVVGADVGDEIGALKAREAAFGAANLVLGVVAVFLAVVKPRLGAARAA